MWENCESDACDRRRHARSRSHGAQKTRSSLDMNSHRDASFIRQIDSWCRGEAQTRSAAKFCHCIIGERRNVSGADIPGLTVPCMIHQVADWKPGWHRGNGSNNRSLLVVARVPHGVASTAGHLALLYETRRRAESSVQRRQLATEDRTSAVNAVRFLEGTD